MKLDTNQAWQEATATVGANRQLAAALAGVFFILPQLAGSLLVREPEVPPGIKPAAAFNLLMDFYKSLAPWILVSALASAVGTIALLTLFANRDRPTVGQAIVNGVKGLLPYFGSQLLVTVGFALIGGVIGGLGAASGSIGLTVLLLLALIVVAIYVAIRTMLVAPAIAAEGLRNPIAALQRSWALTEGNAGRILGFVVLLVVVFMIVVIMVVALTTLALTLSLGQEPARIVAAVVSSILGGTFTVYFTAALGAIHRQLSGGGGGLASTFE